MIIANSTNLNPQSHMNNVELDAKRKQQVDNKNLLGLFGFLPVFSNWIRQELNTNSLVYVKDFKNVGKNFGLVDYHMKPQAQTAPGWAGL